MSENIDATDGLRRLLGDHPGQPNELFDLYAITRTGRKVVTCRFPALPLDCGALGSYIVLPRVWKLRYDIDYLGPAAATVHFLLARLSAPSLTPRVPGVSPSSPRQRGSA